MAFNGPAGPPATARQVARLLELLAAAGHDGFRDARGPLGLTQRQAGGKFSRDEADALISRLEAELEGAPPPPPTVAADRRLQSIPDEALAAELQRRGWVVVQP
ncbi:MAG: hypothetical protein FJW83_06560 [Actinobacteria bacterium]|nr:hypothetical protein [Actinomycetota bacterium]